jgi:phosphoribulokinase
MLGFILQPNLQIYGNPVSVLELDGQLGNLEQVSYIESHLSNISTKHKGEMTSLLLQHREYPGSNNGTGLFQVMVGLKMRATYERLVAEAKVPAKV